MLITAKNLERSDVHGRDGVVGRVDDLYFDDQSWRVRYFVIDTGGWLSGRKVLLASAAITPAGLSVDLTREQVRNSPEIDLAKPVSRQHEEQLHRHYAWPYYWTGPKIGGGVDAPIGGPAAPTASAVHASQQPEGGRAAEIITDSSAEAWREPGDDPHLHSARAIRGYHVEATDGSVGHVEDLVVEQPAWDVRWLAIETRNWLPGRSVLLAPGQIRQLDWLSSSIVVGLTRDEIKRAPEYDSSTPFTADYTDRLAAHYRGGATGSQETQPRRAQTR